MKYLIILIILISAMSCKKNYSSYSCGCEIHKIRYVSYANGFSPFGFGEVMYDKSQEDAKSECMKLQDDWKVKVNDTFNYYHNLDSIVYMDCAFEETKPLQ